jgi:2-(1,2-epoxy-1,2-dihydrophenyl)acetyl-CoA isomerase
LALACDVIVADEAAVLTEAFVNIGLVPDSGSSYFLPRMVGTARAFELCSQGKKITARQAFEWGMINYAVPASSLDEVVREQVSFYSVAPTRAIGLIKQMLNKSTVLTLDEMLEYETYCQEIAGRTEDHQEGVKAFLEKRQPRFSGQ